MIPVGFERITPTPLHPPGVTAAQLSGLAWESQANAVKAFKPFIKTELRAIQQGRCAYCRRLLSYVEDTDLEHVVERATNPDFCYEILNLALSCSPCNTSKNKTFKKVAIRLGTGKNPKYTSLILRKQVLTGSPYPSVTSDYRGVHPHLDNYSQHIQIWRGWIYQPKSAKGRRTIRNIKLNELAAIERRLRQERLLARKGVLSKMVGMLAELDRARAMDLAADLASMVRQKKLGTIP